MPLFLEPEAAPIDLRGRLLRLRRRSRRLALARGSAAIAAAFLTIVTATVAADAVLDLPAGLRAALLVTLLIGPAVMAGRWFWMPWRLAGDELGAARLVEQARPVLGDALASAIQFRARPGDATGSPQLREATVLYAVARTRDLDFVDVADARPAYRAGLALLAAMAIAVPAAWRLPHAVVGVTRLFDPFGNHVWPPQTSLEVTAADAIARGEAFELTAALAGVIPDRAAFVMALDGAPVVEHAYPLTANQDGRESLRIKLEPGRVPRSFRYKLSANDATTGWRSVAVRVPPQLAPLDGRASPHMRLDYPRYTDLPSLELPDGTGATEGVAGTTVTIGAAVDRPVVRAAIEYRPTTPITPASLSALLFAAGPDGALGAIAAAHALTAPTRLTLSAGGSRFDGRFTPVLGGLYELTFADAHGLTGHRAVDVRVLPDASPAVTLDQPSAGGDGAELLADAVFELRATVDDPMIAIRRIAVEFRNRSDEPPRRLPLYDGDQLGRALATMLIAAPHSPAKLRPTHLEIARRLPVTLFRRADGTALTAGDVLSIAVVAEDFDDVTPDKPAGRSFEVEIRIVGRDRLEARLQKQQADLGKALRELHERQTEALELAAEVLRHRRATGELRRDDAERLVRAEALQQHIQERLGDGRDGLRAEASRLHQSRTDNSGAGRAKAAQTARELDRLAEDVLPPTGALLSAARREPGPAVTGERSAGPLPEAVARQRDAEQSLRELAEQMLAGTAAAELMVEAASLTAELDKLVKDRSELAHRLPPGTEPAALPERDRKDLERLKDRHDALTARASGFLQQLDAKSDAQSRKAEAEAAQAERLDAEGPKHDADRARERAETLQREADALAAARATAHAPTPIDDAMRQAADAVGRNQLGVAESRQQNAAKQLEAMRDALRGQSEEDAERLAKHRKAADDAVERLTCDQEKLQDRTLAAEQHADQLSRRQELKELAAVQEQLAERARELSQELRRQGQSDAARELARAARDMDKSRDQLQRGESAAGMQDDALDKLDDAQQRTSEARAEAEEHLRREKIIKLIDRLKGIHDRQASLVAETDRLFQAAADANAWPRPLQKSLADLSRSEVELANEVASIAEKNLESFKVLKRLAEQAGRAMTDSAAAIDDARDTEPTAEALDAAKAEVRSPQDLARRRLAQLIEVLQPTKDNEGEPGGAGRQSSAPGGGTPATETDNLPAMAQLKLLRGLQAELNELIAAFSTAKPEPAKWSNADRAALDALRREQAELAELFAEVVPEPSPPAEKKP